LLEKKRRLVCRRDLTEFSRSVGYEPAAHHRLLIGELEALERGETETLLVFMPPGSAKSTYVNMLFPAWFVARNQERNTLTASHSSELAERWGRKTRNLIAASTRELDVALSSDSQAAHRWSTTKGGEYYAVGVGVGIAGFRADLGIIDDPFGSREDAESGKIRESRWLWYTDDFSSRLKPGARRVIMHTRFHDDDLAGRIMRQLDALDRPYRLLSLPAEALANDPLGREPGELLWDEPSGYDYGAFLRARKAESDPRTWASLYQQNPVPDEGAYFLREWLQPVDIVPKADALRIYGASDYAVTQDGGDYTVHLVVGVDADARMYVLDMWRGRTDSATWIEALGDLVDKWEPLEWAEEGGQIRASLGPFLERRLIERRSFVYRRQFPSRHDKAVRAQSIRGRMSMSGLFLPARAPWRADFESELLRFPAGVHDDQCLAEGTMITLADGSRREIERIAIGDWVSTPRGPARVTASEVTSEAAQVCEVTLSNGETLKATANHPLFVVGKGFVRVDALRYNDRVSYKDVVKCSEEHPLLKYLSIAAIGIADTLRAGISITLGTFTQPNRVVAFCIGTYGRTRSGLSLSGMKSTIRTETPRTTQSTISNVSPRQSIGGSTLSLSPDRQSIWQGSVKLPLSGIRAKLGVSGIDKTVRPRGSAGSLLLGRASAAESSSGRSSDGLGSARGPAVSVIGVQALTKPARVRNLTVEPDHVFYANGVLTHNCDALGLIGQLLDHINEPARPEKPKPKKPRDWFEETDVSETSWKVA
jgi:predicted phage terminase large subunit-like protein